MAVALSLLTSIAITLQVPQPPERAPLSGLVVESVARGSALHRAGIVPGDLLLAWDRERYACDQKNFWEPALAAGLEARVLASMAFPGPSLTSPEHRLRSPGEVDGGYLAICLHASLN